MTHLRVVELAPLAVEHRVGERVVVAALQRAACVHDDAVELVGRGAHEALLVALALAARHLHAALRLQRMKCEYVVEYIEHQADAGSRAQLDNDEAITPVL